MPRKQFELRQLRGKGKIGGGREGERPKGRKGGKTLFSIDLVQPLSFFPLGANKLGFFLSFPLPALLLLWERKLSRADEAKNPPAYFLVAHELTYCKIL